jgi:predicted HAD superfamily hydrolase
MYLPKEIIAGILSQLGVTADTSQILVSCDCKVAKNSGLFDVLRSKVGNARILHIGDNYEADILCAEKFGIDDTFHIGSALTMLEDSYASELLNYDTTLPNRLVIGEFIAQQLNDPFLFARTQGKFEVNTNYELGGSFIAPLLWCFFGWITKRAKELQLDVVLLGSRDGYLISKIHDILQDRYDLPPMRYFYISRAVAVVAGILDDADILHAARLAYAGTPEEMLINRFHLNDTDILERGGERDVPYIMRHKSAILREAERVRKTYLRYVDTLNISSDLHVGFFDFISYGTCHKALTNVLDNRITGLYFIALNHADNYKSHIIMEAMFGTLNVFVKSYRVLQNYFLLENILTSFEPTLAGFDDELYPTFIQENRTDIQLVRLSEIQGGILDYFQNTKSQLPDAHHVDKHIPDLIFGCLIMDCMINTDYFDAEELRDEFCNRTFDLKG